MVSVVLLFPLSSFPSPNLCISFCWSAHHISFEWWMSEPIFGGSMQSCARAGWRQKLVIYDPPYITRQSTRDARERARAALGHAGTHTKFANSIMPILRRQNSTVRRARAFLSCSAKIALTRRRQRYGWVWECHHSRTCWNNFIVSFGSLAILFHFEMRGVKPREIQARLSSET